jgi:hypothetical protein
MRRSRLNQKRSSPHCALLHIRGRSMMALGFAPVGTILALCVVQH